jgi:hypothetical protein
MFPGWRIPIVCVLELVAAGLIAGSIPINGTSYFCLILMVFVVLQATTSLHFSS